MKKITLVWVAALCFFAVALDAQSHHFFQPVAESEIALRDGTVREFFPKKYQTYRLDYAALKTVLQSAPWEFTPEARAQKCVMAIPMADGTMEDFSVWQIAMMDAELAAQYPDIRTYAGESLRTPGRTVRFSCTLRGFRAMFMQPDLETAYVEPHTWGQDEYYLVYDYADLPDERKGRLGTSGWVPDAAAAPPTMYAPPAEERGELIAPVELKVFRYIAAVTGHFSQDHGGTKPLVLSAVTEYTNMISAIFERDANLRLQLAAATQNVMFLDPATDPYTGTTVQDWHNANSDVLNQYCNFNSHDLGHVYARYLGGDASGVGTSGVCGNDKAKGCTSGTGFGDYGMGFVSTIGQEVGHQLNSGHSWNSCNGGPGRAGQSAFEPGSGSTIMSYYGSCGPDNLDGPRIFGFHSGSIEEIKRVYTAGSGTTCGSFLTTPNNPPVVTLPYQSNLFIPIQTPFELNGSATDPDGDEIFYAWEGIDAGPEIPLGQQQGSSAIFRTYAPGSITNRYFPRLSTILSNGTYNAEILPEYTRDVTLRLVVRDNRPDGGGVGWADVALKSWGEAGPFLVTSPNTASATWNIGEYVNVTWDVANTYFAPVNCKKVNIRLSIDGGLTYPITLASGVENNGNYYVLVPNNVTSAARVRVDAADNVFFDISNANFKIQQPTQPSLTMGLSVNAADICLPNDGFTSEILTAGTLGFDSQVALAITGDLPPGASATFSSTTLNPGEASTLTVDLSGVTLEGVFTFNVEATATGVPTLIRSVTVRLVSNDFSALSLQSPPDGGTGLGLSQVLRWNVVPDAETYDVQFSNTPSFATLLSSATSTSVDSFKINFLLEKGKAYYWRVRPRNECGIHDWTEPFFFSTYPENCSVFTANDLPKNISASSTPTVESKITVNAGGAVSSMSIRQIRGYHEFFKDLDARLISPQGTVVVLFQEKCGNYNGFFNFGIDDAAPNFLPCPPPNNGLSYKAENPLAPFYGQDNTGNWTLRVKDNEISSGGTLNDFKLEFCAAVTVTPPYLVNNNPLLIQPGVNEVITQSLLLAEDANNTHDQLVFTLLTVPEFGILDKNGFGTLKPGDQFTQADLDGGVIRFFDYGINGGSDGFRFTVSDGEGGFLGTPKFVIQPTGVGTDEPMDNALQFSLYPNPAHDAVWLALDQPATSEMRASLFNTAGQLVSTRILLTGTDRLQILLTEMPKGIYAVRLEGAAGAGVRKLVVR